jgi:hypothetical protein
MTYKEVEEQYRELLKTMKKNEQGEVYFWLCSLEEKFGIFLWHVLSSHARHDDAASIDIPSLSLDLTRWFLLIWFAALMRFNDIPFFTILSLVTSYLISIGVLYLFAADLFNEFFCPLLINEWIEQVSKFRAKN